jgi:transposase
MMHYAGIDESLEYASVCVVVASGKIVREGKVASYFRDAQLLQL